MSTTIVSIVAIVEVTNRRSYRKTYPVNLDGSPNADDIVSVPCVLHTQSANGETLTSYLDVTAYRGSPEFPAFQVLSAARPGNMVYIVSERPSATAYEKREVDPEAAEAVDENGLPVVRGTLKFVASEAIIVNEQPLAYGTGHSMVLGRLTNSPSRWECKTIVRDDGSPTSVTEATMNVGGRSEQNEAGEWVNTQVGTWINAKFYGDQAKRLFDRARIANPEQGVRASWACFVGGFPYARGYRKNSVNGQPGEPAVDVSFSGYRFSVLEGQDNDSSNTAPQAADAPKQATSTRRAGRKPLTEKEETEIPF